MLYCPRSVPRFQKLSDARIAFVNNRRVVEINDMVMRPSMICNSGAFGRCFYIPYVKRADHPIRKKEHIRNVKLGL